MLRVCVVVNDISATVRILQNSLNDKWEYENRLSLNLRQKRENKVNYITQLRTEANGCFKDVISQAKREQIRAPMGNLMLSTWESLRRAFTTRLVVYELKRRCGFIHRHFSEEPVMNELFNEALETESHFGGVSEEELVRIFRSVYPDIAGQLLPKTAKQRLQEYMSRGMANRDSVKWLKSDGSIEAPLHSFPSMYTSSCHLTSTGDDYPVDPSTRETTLASAMSSSFSPVSMKTMTDLPFAPASAFYGYFSHHQRTVL